jgi:NADPH:quinone reductase-like Zn-dependent oxidoreductase
MPADGVLAEKPPNMTYEEAASIPLAGHTALFFIWDQGNIQAGRKVFVNDASGAFGTYAVQLPKHYGAEVTGVCSTTNVNW